MEQYVYNTTSTDGFFKLNHSSQLLSHYDQCMILQNLMLNIDAVSVVKQYLSQARHFLKLTGISLIFGDQKITQGHCAPPHQCKTLSLKDDHHIIGQIKYYHKAGFNLHDFQLMQELHICTRQILKNVIHHEEVKKLALKDPLTGLGNRGAYQESLQRYMSNSRRKNTLFGLLVIDLDHFKPVNDKFGHQEGDRVLEQFARALHSALRDTDMAFRIGGDEFCCLLEDNSCSANRMIAQRIQRAISQIPVLAKHGISSSIGSVIYQIGESESELFLRADNALYQAKSAGRDCIRIA